MDDILGFVKLSFLLGIVLLLIGYPLGLYNAIRHIQAPWWYYVENALVAQALPVIFLLVALQGKLMDTWPAWIEGAGLTGIFWPFFLIHVLTASLNGMMMVYHDMASHPEIFEGM